MNEAIIYIETVNGAKYYYTNQSYNELRLTTNLEKANIYKNVKTASIIEKRLKLFDKYYQIKGFKSLNICRKSFI